MKMYLIFLTVLQVFLTLGCEEEPIECGEDFCDPATEFCITLSGTMSHQDLLLHIKSIILEIITL